MESATIIAVIGAIPATLAAVAAIIAAKKTGAGNAVVEEIRDQLQRLDKKISDHVSNRRLHRG
jgi:Na+/melibiose symporter-like transporter